mgnify:CR=1 FL=1
MSILEKYNPQKFFALCVALCSVWLKFLHRGKYYFIIYPMSDSIKIV